MPVGGDMTALGPAASDLGMGDALRSQVKDETDEERKKRMREAQQRALMGPAAQMLGIGGLGGAGGRY